MVFGGHVCVALLALKLAGFSILLTFLGASVSPSTST